MKANHILTPSNESFLNPDTKNKAMSLKVVRFLYCIQHLRKVWKMYCNIICRKIVDNVMKWKRAVPVITKRNSNCQQLTKAYSQKISYYQQSNIHQLTCRLNPGVPAAGASMWPWCVGPLRSAGSDAYSLHARAERENTAIRAQSKRQITTIVLLIYCCLLRDETLPLSMEMENKFRREIPKQCLWKDVTRKQAGRRAHCSQFECEYLVEGENRLLCLRGDLRDKMFSASQQQTCWLFSITALLP